MYGVQSAISTRLKRAGESRNFSWLQSFLEMRVMVPRVKIQVSCLSEVAMRLASSFPLGSQTSRTLPGSCILNSNAQAHA